MRWIIWTLAAHERKQPELYLGKLLTKRSVMLAVLQRCGVYELAISNQLQHVRASITPSKGRRVHVNASPNSVAESSPVRNVSCSSIVGNQKRKFGIKSGGMSPLQRITDIRSLTAPVIVCLSICVQKAYDHKVNISRQKPVLDDLVLAEITDGWWWSRAKLDKSLSAMVASV